MTCVLIHHCQRYQAVAVVVITFTCYQLNISGYYIVVLYWYMVSLFDFSNLVLC